MLPNKEEYGGIKQVFTFSLQQYFKQKATFVMLLIMLLCSVGSVFIMSASMKRGQNANRDGEVLYILNESPSLYGAELSVAFLSRLREERTFPSREALSQQIGRDVETAKKLFVSEKKTVYNPMGLW